MSLESRLTNCSSVVDSPVKTYTKSLISPIVVVSSNDTPIYSERSIRKFKPSSLDLSIIELFDVSSTLKVRVSKKFYLSDAYSSWMQRHATLLSINELSWQYS